MIRVTMRVVSVAELLIMSITNIIAEVIQNARLSRA